MNKVLSIHSCLLFKIALFISALIILLLTGGVLYSLIFQSLPAFRHFGFLSFFCSSGWKTGEEEYRTLSFIAGTFSTAIPALLISIPFSLSLALLNNVYRKGTKIARGINAAVDLCAQIPSIILGVWGYFSLRPLLLSLHAETYGLRIFATALVLSLMIIPYITSLIVYFFDKIPENIKEGAYCLGATHTEVIRKVYFPFAQKGIAVACLMAFGKVLGETMIVCMLAGNTITSLIAGQFENAGELQLSELFAVALFLFLTTAIINSITIYIKKRITL
ncbi:MAG: ABC transporter permease subunit [Dysgonamonadaceae bacterium]|jgi:phosphate transport system permease protein|nr:ABC transporter permease subunit [Dysgonamonadaceae bacterium]